MNNPGPQSPTLTHASSSFGDPPDKRQLWGPHHEHLWLGQSLLPVRLFLWDKSPDVQNQVRSLFLVHVGEMTPQGGRLWLRGGISTPRHVSIWRHRLSKGGVSACSGSSRLQGPCLRHLRTQPPAGSDHWGSRGPAVKTANLWGFLDMESQSRASP